MNQMTSEEVAWLVGIFDGEGCVSIKEVNGGKQQNVVLKVKMTDFDVIESLHRVTGVGTLFTVPAYGNRKATLVWQVQSAAAAVDLLTVMKEFPLLSSRRKLRMEEALLVAMEVAERIEARKELQTSRFEERKALGHTDPTCSNHENATFSINYQLQVQCSQCMNDWRVARQKVEVQRD